MIIIIFIIIVILIMLFTTKPRKNLKWLRYSLIAILIGLLALYLFDYIQSFTSRSDIQPY